MNIFVYRNGVTDGPYDLEDLRRMGIGPDDLVWFRGQSQWMRACEAPHTSRLFTGHQSGQPASTATDSNGTGRPDGNDAGTAGARNDVGAQDADCGAAADTATGASEEVREPEGFFGKPVTYLVCNLLTCFCCCCNILSLPSLIFSIRAMMAYKQEDRAKRAACLRQARLWSIISLVSGPVIILILWLIIFLTGGFDGISERIPESLTGYVQ